MKSILLLLAGFLTSIFANAQLVQTARAELTMRSDFSTCQIWPQPDSTLLVLNVEPTYRRNLDPFTLYHFNHDLNLQWKVPVSVPRGNRFLKLTTEKQYTYLLFQPGKATELNLVIIHLPTGQQQLSTHLMPEGMSFALSDLSVLNGYLFLTGFQDNRLTLLHLNPAEKELVKLPAIYDQTSALTEFLTDTVAKRMEFVLGESNGRRSRLQVKRLAPDGHLVSLNFINRPDRNFLAARLAPGDSTRKLVIGTYSYRDLRYAQGFFTGPLTLQPGEDFRYHDFTDFSHYFDYLRPNRQIRLRQKVARQKLTQKIFHLRHRVLLHALKPYLGGYLTVGELYAPHYTGDGPERIFDGYQHATAIVAAFDNKGNLRWENSFPLRNIRFFDLTEIVTTAINKDQVLLAFQEENKIRYKLLNNSEATSNDLFLEITPPGEKILRHEPEGMSAWYRNNILEFGVQHLRGSKGTRAVFYLNKLTF
jgi:hypothetical protein